MENPQNKWGFLAGKIIYFYGPWLPMVHGYVSHNQWLPVMKSGWYALDAAFWLREPPPWDGSTLNIRTEPWDVSMFAKGHWVLVNMWRFTAFDKKLCLGPWELWHSSFPHMLNLAAVDPQLMMDMLVHHFSVIAHRLDRSYLLRRPAEGVSYPQLPETRTEGTLRWVRGGTGGQQPLLWAHGRPMGSQDAGGGNSAQRRVGTCWGRRMVSWRVSRMVSCQQTICTGDSVGAGGTKPSIYLFLPVIDLLLGFSDCWCGLFCWDWYRSMPCMALG